MDNLWKEIRKEKFLKLSLTYPSNTEKEASMAKVVFGRLELFRLFKVGQFLSHRTSVRQCIAWKVLPSTKKENNIIIKTYFVPFISHETEKSGKKNFETWRPWLIKTVEGLSQVTVVCYENMFYSFLNKKITQRFLTSNWSIGLGKV